MEILIGAISVSSLALNYLVYRRTVAIHKAVTTSAHEETLLIEAEPVVEAPVTVPMVQDVYLSRALPSRSNGSPGPLERPGGFV